MQYGDHEHKAFEKYAKEVGLDLSMHPLHLIYLSKQTAEHLAIFKLGYKSGSTQPKAT